MARLFEMLFRLSERSGLAPFRVASPAGLVLAEAPAQAAAELDRRPSVPTSSDGTDEWGSQGLVYGVTAPGSPYH